jgi:molybdate transport system substrate-binding protein
VTWADNRADNRAGKRARFIAALVASVGLLALPTYAASAGEIRIAYPPPMRTVLLELLPQFARATGHEIVAIYEPSAAIIARLDRGESVDVAILTAHAIDQLIARGKLSARVDLARSVIGLAVRSGAPRPDIATALSFRRTLLAAKSFARNEGADSGIFVAGLLEQLGIAAEMEPKTTRVRSGYVAELVARGEVEMAAQQVAELMAVPGVDVTPLPEEIQHVIVFAAAMPAAPRDPDAAMELVRFLASAANAPVWRTKGHRPM